MRRGLLTTQRDFRRLWLGHTISAVGTQVSALAVPLVAVVGLHASALSAAALYALEYAPYALIGLPAGAWIDRHRRRPVLITTDLVRAGLLALVPLAAVTGLLSLPLLFAIVLAVGAASVFFMVANQAYLPAVVDRHHLVEANSRISASSSAASTAGPAIGGWLVGWLTAPVALVVDAASYLVSAALVGSLRADEARPTPRATGRGPLRADEGRPRPRETGRSTLRADMRAGLRVVLDDPLLRTLTANSAAGSLCVMMASAVEVVFLVRTVGLSSRAIGGLFALSGLGAVLGAVLAGRVRRRLGELRTLIVTSLVAGAGLLLVPLTGPGPRLACYVVGVGTASGAIVAANVVSIALLQRRCPDRLLGRVVATNRFLAWSTPPVGALLGGLLASAAGPRAALAVAGGLFTVAAVHLTRRLRSPDVQIGPLAPESPLSAVDDPDAVSRSVRSSTP
jgi:MFS family permease